MSERVLSRSPNRWSQGPTGGRRWLRGCGLRRPRTGQRVRLGCWSPRRGVRRGRRPHPRQSLADHTGQPRACGEADRPALWPGNRPTPASRTATPRRAAGPYRAPTHAGRGPERAARCTGYGPARTPPRRPCMTYGARRFPCFPRSRAPSTSYGTPRFPGRGPGRTGCGRAATRPGGPRAPTSRAPSSTCDGPGTPASSST